MLGWIYNLLRINRDQQGPLIAISRRIWGTWGGLVRITKPGTFPRRRGRSQPINVQSWYGWHSKNMGFYPPKSSILIGFGVWNHYFHHPFWDTPIFGNIHMIPWAQNARYSHMHCSEFMHTDEISHLQGWLCIIVQSNPSMHSKQFTTGFGVNLTKNAGKVLSISMNVLIRAILWANGGPKKATSWPSPPAT